MAFDRIGSYILYASMTVLTCVMAHQVHLQHDAPARIGGQCTRQRFRNGLFLAGIFWILFIVSALRFDIGNDYGSYTATAHEAHVGGYVVTEIGFNTLVRILYGLAGGEVYELVFAVFAFFTLIIFLKAFLAQSECFSQTFFLFMTLGLYFQTFNTIRYYLALSVALYSMRSVLERDWIRFVFWILAASLFHRSVLLVLPAYWIASLEWERWHIIAGAVLCAACSAARGILLHAALLLYPSYKDTVYLEGGGSLASVLRILAVLALYAWLLRYRGEGLKKEPCYRKLRFYAHLNLMALAAGTFFTFLPVVTRIVYYFSVSQLLMIPLIIRQIREERLRKRAIILTASFCAGCFVLFLLQAHQDGVGLLPYKSWLFGTKRYTYQ